MLLEGSRPPHQNRSYTLLYMVVPWLPTMRREKLIKIGARLVKHGRYKTFQLAEVAIPRPLFAEILRLIDGPQPKPTPT